MTTFTHPLARKARAWPLGGASGEARSVLVVVTTLKLNFESKNYKADMVTRLSAAAAEWISFHQDQASDFVLVNRVKDW